MAAPSERSVRSKPYRGHNFPYHLNPQPSPGGGFRLSSSRKLNSRGNNTFGESSRPGTAPETPSSYMVLNFRNQFIDETIVDTLHKDIRIEEKRLRQIQQEAGIAAHNYGMGPKLAHSFLLPRNPNAPPESRNMVGRADVSTQTDCNLNRHEFDGLSKYQSWTNNEVEPFFKELKKAVKAQRPEDMHAYVIAYCQAMMSSDPLPETVTAATPIMVPEVRFEG